MNFGCWMPFGVSPNLQTNHEGKEGKEKNKRRETRESYKDATQDYSTWRGPYLTVEYKKDKSKR